MNSKLKTAFTLVELLVVIAIVGILSGLIIVGMSSSVKSASIAKGQIFSMSLRDSLLMNLLTEWKFDNTSDLCQDSWSTYNCTLNGAPQARTSGCVYGNCINFDGVDDYTLATNPIDFSKNSFTISTWILPTDLAQDAGSNRTFLTIRADANNRLRIHIYASGQLSSVLAVGGTIYALYANNAIVANTWSNVVIVNNGGTQYAYINGVDRTTSRDSSDANSSAISGFVLGLLSTTSGRFIGSIDDTRAYNIAMPSSQIKEQYYAGLNNLLSDRMISKEEYLGRIKEL